MLTVALLLMGIALLGGAMAALVGPSIAPLDQLDLQVGTKGSAAGAVLGIGLIVAAFRPSAGWVLAGILYGFVVVAFEAGMYLLHRGTFHLGPVIFGLAFSLLLIALFPQRRSQEPKRVVAPAAAPPARPVAEPEPGTPKATDSELGKEPG
jgi:hypothetical protein